MNAEQFKELVKKVKVAKKLPDAIYFHKDAFSHAPLELKKFVDIVAKALKIPDDKWNLVKLFKSEFRLSLLHYPEFYNDSYPALHQSVTVDLVKLTHKVTKYDSSENPPILHRKETMIGEEHPSYQLFCDITAEGEQAGLYENTRMIGFQNSWLRLIAKKGYELVNGRLFRTSALPELENEQTIDRHLTAIVRYELSAPMKALAKNGYLTGDYSIFDYGCGRGDDLRELEAHGIDALGWDPNYRPDADKVNSDIVNIGFVINVIEDRDERIEAILGAWELSDKLLVVSAMLGNESLISQFQPYKDGVITSRNTFQKYYTQTELKTFIEMTLDETAIAVSPGIFFIFKEKQLEQQFLQNRHKRAYHWQHLTAPEPVNENQARILFTQHEKLFESFWITCLSLGRCPANDEFDQSNKIKEVIGSNKKALQLVLKWYNKEELTLAEQMRKEDILLYFALAQFEKRKPYTQQPEDLKRDIKVFFDNYKIVQNQATELLYEIANVELINQLCLDANKTLPASKLDYENGLPHALTLHKDFIPQLPLVLRVYIGAALQMFGDLDDIQLIKIHINSGKVTLLGFEGFDTTPLPQLKERVKIKMAEQDVDFFDYIIEEKRPLLLDKINYIDETFDDYKKQKAFNKRLLKEFEFTEVTKLNINQIENLLKQKALSINGYRFFSV
ncbi:DNA phosphorothioation-associated putative methyltransferase [Pseudoalteromonas sp. G4]|uniref:DNA phosphorothioation-associated putative methyltransferase n=1 Tax=Pseudoalteromonas sp. G4 TaxID=2992761 RepID=UPI00237D7865|nr:DNA phosphorothioation-associated putative methyltransferase [Pseudoalteromonas sp. G4]MDE3271799.1 DNA phosphorothioation-associated putative methyltransferase [Pseudoalteromonas sp. G4]